MNRMQKQMRGNPAMGEEELAIPAGNKALRRSSKKKKKGFRADARCFGKFGSNKFNSVSHKYVNSIIVNAGLFFQVLFLSPPLGTLSIVIFALLSIIRDSFN